jgi:hypothetical protein
MASKDIARLGIAGAAALLLLMSTKKKGGAKGSPGSSVDEDDRATPLPGVEAEEQVPAGSPYDNLFRGWDSGDKAIMGRLYQVREGDTLLGISREVLFGSREPRVDGSERQLVIDYSIRIDCSPWNQTVAGRGPEMLKPGHFAVENGWSKKGVCFLPIFSDNKSRLRQGKPPSTAKGKSYPYIWLPMLNLDVLEKERRVTVEGMNHPDDGHGEFSMIDPPPWVVDLGFTGSVESTTGCELPEGDFRKRLEPY